MSTGVKQFAVLAQKIKIIQFWSFTQPIKLIKPRLYWDLERFSTGTEMENVGTEDGKWFLRAYDHFGKAVGSKSCTEGRIFIEPQGLCAIAGIGVKEGLVKQALKAVEDQLATEHGSCCCSLLTEAIIYIWVKFPHIHLGIKRIRP